MGRIKAMTLMAGSSPFHSCMRFQAHARGTAGAMFIATTLWRFKVPASKQAAAVYSKITLKFSVARPPV